MSARRLKNSENSIKNVFSMMTSNSNSLNSSERKIIEQSKPNKTPNLNIIETNNYKRNFGGFNRDKATFKKYEMKRRKDLLEIRNKKMKELYEMEKENIEFELIAKNKKSLIKGTSNFTIENKDNLLNNEEETKIPSPINLVNKESINQKYSIEALQNNLQENKIAYDFAMNKNTYPLPGNKSYNVDMELDKSIRKYNENLEKLKMEDFMSRKRMQDELLNNINSQMEKLKYGLNDKSYEEKLAQSWLKEYQERMNQRLLQNENQSNTQTVNNPNFPSQNPFLQNYSNTPYLYNKY